MMAKSVYVDLNAFMDQWFPGSDEQYVLNSQEERTVRKSIKSGELIIPLALDVIDENAPANYTYQDNDETIREKNTKEIFKWSSVEVIWKPIDMIEKDSIETEFIIDEMTPFLPRVNKYESIYSLAAETKSNPTNENFKKLQNHILQEVMDKKEGMEDGFRQIRSQMSESELEEERQKVEKKLKGEGKDPVYEHKATDEHLFLLVGLLAKKRGVNIPSLPRFESRIKESQFLRYHTTNVLKVTLFHLLDSFGQEKPEGIDIYDLAHAGVGFYADYFVSHDEGLKKLIDSSLPRSKKSPELLTFPELASCLDN